MSDKAGPNVPAELEGDVAKHGNAIAEGVTTAFSWLTILPVRGAQTFDRITGRRTMTAAPLAGIVPGLLVSAVATAWVLLQILFDDFFELDAEGMVASRVLTPLLLGAVSLVLAELSTRAMHIDGLADVADALGSYKDPKGAQKVLSDPATGPMGVGAVALYAVVMTTGLGVLIAKLSDAALNLADARPLWISAGLTLVLPFMVGRASATTACLHYFPPMRPTGFGGLAAATQSLWGVVLWWIALGALSAAATGAKGIFAVIAAVALAVLISRHCVRRLGGINGDILGAIIQITTSACLVIFAL